jgi:Tfp pilus assembly protein PilO
MPEKRERRVKLGAWEKKEIIIVIVSATCLVLSVLFYVFIVLPEANSLNRNIAERDRLRAELEAESQKYRNFTTTEEQINALVKSAEDFEIKYLPVADLGRTALYQRLNNLISQYKLVNTSGPDYTPLEVLTKQSQSEERGRARFQSLFPGVYVTMTLEGSYSNLRKFIRDIEASNQFTIIASIELETSSNQPSESQRIEEVSEQPFVRPGEINQVRPGVGGANPEEVKQSKLNQKGKVSGEVVSLKIELASYFRRPVVSNFM